MVIRNLLSTIPNRAGSMAIVLLGLLPIPPKFAKSSRADKLQRLINADRLPGVFELISRHSTVRRRKAALLIALTARSGDASR